jgi:hypothetical protein
MNKLVIDPQKLAEIRAAIHALDHQKPPADELPAKVKAFWLYEPPIPRPWRLESSEDRQQREAMERAGLRWL